MKTILFLLFTLFLITICCPGQNKELAATPYGQTTPQDIKVVMDRIRNYVDGVTPFAIVNQTNGEKITALVKPAKEATISKGAYSLTSHEWGLLYTSMLAAGQATGDPLYANYVSQRFDFLGKATAYFRAYKKAFPAEVNPLEKFLYPHLLDDTGSMCAAMIQGLRNGMANDLKPEIDQSISFIMSGVHRLSDGTFARNRPMPNSVWVDDLYQGIPALAEYGKLTGEKKYFDEATRQVILFSELLFDKRVGACKHGWVEGMDRHPSFFWARANGWAILAISSLLDVLPENHPQRKTMLELFKAYCHGIVTLQSGTGFWHQLMDRNDSFLETSATAMFTYVLAHGVNKGWLDIQSYGPPALLAWNAISTKVNDKGQVEGTSAGTSMAFDAAFYYQRPVGTGPHGYGSVLLAGAAMYKLLKEHQYESSGPVIFR